MIIVCIYTELDLQSCSQLTSEDLLLLNKLTKLKRLNLYRMRLDENVLDSIGRYVVKLSVHVSAKYDMILM